MQKFGALPSIKATDSLFLGCRSFKLGLCQSKKIAGDYQSWSMLNLVNSLCSYWKHTSDDEATV